MNNADVFRFRVMNIMRVLAALVCLLWFGVLALWADTHYVSLDGGNTPPYTSWGNAATEIQWAVDVAGVSDTVLVSNGTYNLTNQIYILTNITVRSFTEQGHGTNDTIINGNNYVGKLVTNRCFYMSNGILNGFTISNGCIAGGGYRVGGGGIFTAGGSVYNCFICGNYVSNNGSYSGGGGIFTDGSGVVISNCAVFSNTVEATSSSADFNRAGGGIYVCSATPLIIASHISGNTAYIGGGIYGYYSGGAITVSNCTIDANRAVNSGGINFEKANSIAANCVISNNVADRSTGGVRIQGGAKVINSIITCNVASNGGGVYVAGFGSAGSAGVGSMVSNCQVIANTASNEGGGIYFDPSYNSTVTVVIADSVIAANVAKTNGAGIATKPNAGETFPLYPTNGGVIINCLIYGNTNLTSRGGGVRLNNLGTTYGQYVLINCTIAGNQAGTAGGGVWAGAANQYTDGVIVNCIIYSNTTTNDVYDEIYNNNAVNTNNYFRTCVRSTPGAADTTLVPNQGNITNDPMFIDPGNNNYRLSANSPCINAGTNQSWMTNSYDLDRLTRIRYGTVDMGAYEGIYNGTIYKLW